MATIVQAQSYPIKGDNKVIKVLWETLTTTNTTGDAFTLGQFSDRSIQVAGTFDGATVTIQGSNNGADYVTLNDPSSTALTFTAAKIEAVLENVLFIRPIVSGGTGSTDLDVIMCARRN